MKVRISNHEMHPHTPEREWDSEVRHAVKNSVALTADKHGFRTATETWRNCHLYISLGHNIDTTFIEIRPPANDLIRRRANWRNGYAYYCNGAFWANICGTKVELI